MPTLSELLGYTAIACWFCAQIPQVIYNYHRQSCDGLSLPFLINWFLGDLSNLIGCILTHQLPFQAYLATYFVFIDLSLCWQYYYYYCPPKLEHPRVYAHSRITTDATIRRFVSDRGSRRYRSLSAAAANVAAAAAVAAQQQEQFNAAGHVYEGAEYLEEEEPITSALSDSFHSERIPHRTRRISWSNEELQGVSVGRHTSVSRSALVPSGHHYSPERTLIADSLSRGRSLQRDPEDTITIHEESSANRRSSRASRRGAGLVFLSVWALFGVGTLVNNAKRDSSDTTRVGSVLLFTPSSPVAYAYVPVPTPFPVTELASSVFLHPPAFAEDPHHDSPRHEGPTTQRIIGRISAWLCTILYLTSRLPQIWKNFIRKSVEGLSISLFVFAFLGNTFYVSSILTSPLLSAPHPISTDFIRESIPYLLGSAGTLMFDVTIVAQSFVYRPHSRKRRASTSRLVLEEEGALLRDDSLDPTELAVGE